jgi:type IV pilus assembly protein PilW
MPRRIFSPHGLVSQRGLSLVELMVGIAVGLFIVAGASVVVSTQLADNRSLLLETQLHQDLRATADIITRELRRAGAEESAASHVWAPAGSASSAHSSVTLSAGLDQVGFEYVRAANPGPWGFKLEQVEVAGVQRGVIRTLLATGGWHDLTDRNTLDVTAFRVAPIPAPPAPPVTETLPCARACSVDPNDITCWPELEVRTYEIAIAAQAVSDPRVQRSIRSTVRLRNDRLVFKASQACP